MAKVWKKNNLIPWICNEDEEDFFASIGDYRFRVEQMGERQWWWNVTYKGDEIMTDLNNFASSKTNAVHLAEGVYYGHKAACNVQNLTFLSRIQKQANGKSNHLWDINQSKTNQDNGSNHTV
jgi:hypothetical protein